MITLFCIRPKGFNIGNDVIYLGLQHLLYRAFGRVVNVLSVPTTSRYESQAKAGLTEKIVHEINQFGHGVIVGGGNVYENGELAVNLNALEALEPPLFLYSLSYGRIYNRRRLVRRTDAMPHAVAQALTQRARHTLARDLATQQFLGSLGFESVPVGGCPSLFLDELIDRLPHLAPSDCAETLISIRHPALMSIPLEKQAQVPRDITAIIEFLRRCGVRDIRLLCHDQRDIPFAASFPSVEYMVPGDVWHYLSLLRSCHLNVSYRLHAMLPCLAFGTPAIMISYDERGMSMMETLGFGSWQINMITSDDVVAEVIDRYHRLNDLVNVRQEAQPTWQALRNVTQQVFQQFVSEVSMYAAKNGDEYTEVTGRVSRSRHC